MRLDDLTPEVREYVLRTKIEVPCPKCGRLTNEPQTERVRLKDGSFVERKVWVHWLPDDPTSKFELDYTGTMLVGSSEGVHNPEYKPCFTDILIIRKPRKTCPKCQRLGREFTDKRGYRYFHHGPTKLCYIGKR